MEKQESIFLCIKGLDFAHNYYMLKQPFLVNISRYDFDIPIRKFATKITLRSSLKQKKIYNFGF